MSLAGEGSWGEVGVAGSLHPSPPAHTQSVRHVWERGQFPGQGTPRGKDKEPVPTHPTPPQPPSSREAVIIIFCHLLGELQVLLFSFTPFLGQEVG